MSQYVVVYLPTLDLTAEAVRYHLTRKEALEALIAHQLARHPEMWSFEPGDIIRNAQHLEAAVAGVVVRDSGDQDWKAMPRKREGRRVRARWEAGLGWAMSSKLLVQRGPLTIISVPWEVKP